MTDVFIMAGLFNVSPNWLWNLLRGFFAFIDFLVYGFIEIFFRTIFNLANFEFVGLYEVFEQRVYVILGIFMLFKVTVSLITYLVNPDKISDKEQGMAKVVTRIITVLVMLIGLPTFFNLMTEFQNKLLPVVPRVIMRTANTLEGDDVSGIASNMSLTMLQGFASYKEECDPDSDVQNIWGDGTTNNLSTISDFLDHINDTCSSGGRKIYAYDYLPGFSTIVGILMIYVLFSLCITVAIRTFKLIILRMIAPVPVVSYIDPKSSKDGMFSTWTKTFISTWGELFLLLGIIYFIVYMISFILSANFWSGFLNGITNPIDGVLLLAFLIIGLLFFAKQAPKFFFDALGIKTKGNFMRMLGMGAAAIGGVGAARAAYRARNEYDTENNRGSHRLRNAGASLFSGLGSSMAGGNAVLSSDKPTLRTGFDAMAKNNATALSRINAGSTLGGRLGAMGQTLWTGESDYARMSREKSGYENANKAILGYKNTLEKKALEKTNLFIDLDDKHKGINYLEFMAHSDGAKNGNAESLKWFINHGFAKEVEEQEEYMETYTEWDDDGAGGYIQVTKQRPATKTVTKTVADWQGAQLYLDKIKDLQTQAHGKNLVAAVEKYERDGDTSVFTDYGTEYNDYRLASDAAKDVNLKVDFSTYAIGGADASKGDTVGIKQALGETNKRVTGVVTDANYKAAKANADATKN